MNSRSFTMMELMVVVGILVFGVAGLLVVYVNCLALNEHNLKLSVAMNLARQMMEDVYYRRSDWDSIQDTSYSEQDIAGSVDYGNIEGYSATMCVTEIAVGSLKEVTVVICWREKGGRIIGEDNGASAGATYQLNGQLDTNEDQNGDGRLSSPCELTTVIANR